MVYESMNCVDQYISNTQYPKETRTRNRASALTLGHLYTLTVGPIPYSYCCLHISSVILTTDMLSAWDDSSAAESIVFTVTSRPKHGHLELTSYPGRRITSFTQIDLAAGRVKYTHDGSARQLSDAFEFEVGIK